MSKWHIDIAVCVTDYQRKHLKSSLNMALAILKDQKQNTPQHLVVLSTIIKLQIESRDQRFSTRYSWGFATEDIQTSFLSRHYLIKKCCSISPKRASLLQCFKIWYWKPLKVELDDGRRRTKVVSWYMTVILLTWVVIFITQGHCFWWIGAKTFAIMLLLFEIECQCTICKLARISPNEGIVALSNK